MVVKDGENGVRVCLKVCGADTNQITAILEEGFERMADLLILKDKEILDMMAAIT
jgi:hypothetical protein